MKFFKQYQKNGEFRDVKDTGDAQVVFSSNLSLDFDRLVEEYGLDENTLLDVRDKYELPRVDFIDGFIYIFIRFPKMIENKVHSVPVLFAFNGNEIFLIENGNSLNIDKVLSRDLVKKSQDLEQLLFAIISVVTNEYLILVNKLSKTLDYLDKVLRNHEINNQDLVHFASLESNLRKVKMNLTGMIKSMSRIDRVEIFNNVEYLQDVLQQLNQLLVLSDGYLQDVVSIRETYRAIADNILNDRMKKLTALTILVALPNVIFGMYGMNISLPIADKDFAFFIIAGFSILLILLAYWLVKRSRLI